MTKLNLQQIQAAIQNQSANWIAGVTSVSQLSEEQQNLRLGLDVPESERERIRLALVQTKQPEFVFAGERDWRNKDGHNWVTDIKDQGNCGSCVAFATVATLETQARIQLNKPSRSVDLSEADLFFCGAGRKCNQGWWPVEALNYAKEKGISEESCFPYQDRDLDCTPCSDRQNRLLKIGKWQEFINISQRKDWLDQQGPLVACMAVYRDFFYYQDGVYKHLEGDLAGYHAITCIGYSEDEQCWICKNSWGSDWGKQGFFKIAYGEAGIDTDFAMYGSGELKGPLMDSEDEEQKKGWAKYAVVEQSLPTEGEDSVLWAYVEDKWRYQQLSDVQLAALGPTLCAANSLQVIYQGEQIVKIQTWKQFS